MSRIAATLRRLWRQLTRVEVTRPDDDRASAATDPETLRNIPPGGVPPN